MKDKIHVAELGATTACTLRLLEDAQRGDDQSSLDCSPASLVSMRLIVTD
jgi:hypothetical protein